MVILIFIVTLILTVMAERILIPYLTRHAAQPIYEEGPAWHLTKRGTPTMGGLGFIFAISVSLLIACIIYPANTLSFITVLLFAIANSIVGIVDDLAKLRKKQNAGLKPYQKLMFQLLIAVIFLMARCFFMGDETELYFSRFSIDAGLLYFPLAIIIILGTTNCANLTDGIDGLASSVAMSIGFVFILLGASRDYSIAPICAALIGGTLGFLFFNRHPAKVFMGDTGSLFLGGFICALAFVFGNPTVLLFIGGVYALEGISVIVQVTCFKLTGKRLLKMAPLHHHLEKCGFSENKICLLAIILTVILSICAGFIYLS